EGHGQDLTVAGGPDGAVGGEFGHRPLAQVEVDDGHAAAGVQQAADDVDGEGGVARPALFVADDDDRGVSHGFPSLRGAAASLGGLRDAESPRAGAASTRRRTAAVDAGSGGPAAPGVVDAGGGADGRGAGGGDSGLEPHEPAAVDLD